MIDYNEAVFIGVSVRTELVFIIGIGVLKTFVGGVKLAVDLECG